MRYIVEIEQSGGRYQGSVHQGNPTDARMLTDLQLGPHATLEIKGQTYSLQALAQALIKYRPDDLHLAFDERGQFEQGQHLYRQIFGGLNAVERKQLHATEVELIIVTDDEDIARLPWVLIADRGVFLSTTGWSVSIASTQESLDCELPPSPRMLVVMPQPIGVAETKAEEHLEQLEELLSSANPRHELGRDLRPAYTWEEFTQSVTDFQPHIIYYYGHGVGNTDTSHLVFAAGDTHSRKDIPVADMAVCLQNSSESPPLLIYVNCCQGDAGGLLGVGQRLGKIAPAVVTNRTIAQINAAQVQGLAFWRSVLLDGAPPHTALTRLHTSMVNQGFSLGDARWMTPVLHRHYATWTANPPRPRSRLERDPHWRLKLDRVRQFGEVFFLTYQMLQEQKPRSLAYVWYGQEGQGIDLFHRRLTVELEEKLPGAYLYEVRPDWPVEFHNPARSFEDMLTEAFEVNALEDIPAQIRSHNRGVSGRQTLIYIRHQPIRSSKIVDPRLFKIYLEWWDTTVAPLLKGQVFALLGVSFVMGKPEAFHRRLVTKEKINEIPLSHTVFRLLDEMEHVTKKDLSDFLQTHNIALPLPRRERILDEIIARTEGHYEMTLEALKDIAERAWSLAEAQPATPSESGDEDDYD